MVWEGISLVGRIDLHVVINGTLTAVGYRDEMLSDCQTLRWCSGPGFLLVQDNAWPQVARV